MAGDVIRDVYSEIADMKNAIQKALSDLEDTHSQVTQVAGLLENGGLQCKAGAALVQGMKGTLVPNMARLMDYCRNMMAACDGAAQDMQQSDSQAAGLFG